MYDPASRDLIDKLEQFTSVRERDLSRCAAYVRLLNRDLPMFDSIWLDALVQRRLLTPFQADSLSERREEFLRVGEYLLVDQLQQNQVHFRYLAQHAQTKKRFLIDEYRQPVPCPSETASRLSHQRSQILRNRQTGENLLPLDYISKENSLFVVHPYFRGLTAGELLVRRGRFPEALLKVISRQLLRQLGEMERAGIVHGDLRIGNLVFSRGGSIRLLNTGVIPALIPHWTLNVTLPFECYDGFAPEMIRDGTWTHQTDLYSAGCLLWQMACGRSPVYSADSLLKIRKHVSHSIPDVREFAPDIDLETARLINQLTRREPGERPDSASGILIGKKQEYFSGKLIRNYVKEFEQPISSPSRYSPRTTILAVLCLLAALAGWGARKQLHPENMNQLLLSITGSQVEPSHVQEKHIDRGKSAGEKSGWEQAIPLPSPDEQGVLELVAGRVYRSHDLTSVGPLQIVTKDSQTTENAIVLIANQPWRISATHLSMKNITVELRSANRSATEKTPAPPALLVCQSLTFEADQCQFNANREAGDLQQLRSIAWKPLSSSEVNAGRLTVSNCRFYSPGTAIMLGGTSRRVHIENCLKSGSGDFLELSPSQNRKSPEIQCEQLTLRQSDSFVRLHLDNSAADKPVNRSIELTIDATNCVFDLSPSSIGLITFSSTESPAGQIRKIDLLGQILLLSPQSNLAGWWNPETNQASTIEIPGTVEGVLAYEMEFAGRDLSKLSDSVLSNYQGPRWNSVSPGIDLSQMKTHSPAEKKTVSRPDTD